MEEGRCKDLWGFLLIVKFLLRSYFLYEVVKVLMDIVYDNIMVVIFIIGKDLCLICI